jgi:hypothetical protein
MRPVLSKILAIVLVVLGVSPFTAPFSIVDLTAASGQSRDRGAKPDQPSNDHGRHGALLKTTAGRLLPPALAPRATAAPRQTALPSILPADCVDSPSSRRVPIQVLRI